MQTHGDEMLMDKIKQAWYRWIEVGEMFLFLKS